MSRIFIASIIFIAARPLVWNCEDDIQFEEKTWIARLWTLIFQLMDSPNARRTGGHRTSGKRSPHRKPPRQDPDSEEGSRERRHHHHHHSGHKSPGRSPRNERKHQTERMQSPRRRKLSAKEKINLEFKWVSCHVTWTLVCRSWVGVHFVRSIPLERRNRGKHSA